MIASSTVYGRCSRSAAGWITLARTRNPAMTKVMLATVVKCRFLYARNDRQRSSCCPLRPSLSGQIVSFSGRGAPQSTLALIAARLAQFEALDLAGRGLRQLVEESDPARAFERCQHSLGVAL